MIVKIFSVLPLTNSHKRFLRTGMNKVRFYSKAFLQRSEKVKLEAQSASLTFYTMLSIVPLLAMAFGVAKGFGVQETLYKSLLQAFSGYEDLVQQMIAFADQTLEATSGGLVAVLGLLLLVYSVIQMLSSIENVLNDIWRVEKGRTIVRKITDYVMIVLVSPFLLVTSSSLNVTVAGGIERFEEWLGVGGLVSWLFELGIGLLPVVFIWILFALFFLILPNTEVSFSAALTSGFITAVVFNLVQVGYIEFQVGVSRMNTIYGSFAAVPLFFIWVQISWRVVLYGSVLSNFFQIKPVLSSAETWSWWEKKNIAITMLSHLYQGFKDSKVYSISELVAEFGYDEYSMEKIIESLEKAGIVGRLRDEKGVILKVNPDKITLFDIWTAMDSIGTTSGETGHLNSMETKNMLFKSAHSLTLSEYAQATNKS